MTARGRVRTYGPAALLILALIGIWEAAARLLKIEDYLLPAPDQIVSTLYDERSTLGSATLLTLTELLVGLGMAIVAGLLIAFLLHASATVRRTLYPILIGSQNVPIVVIAPILAIMLGYGIGPKLIVVALVCFFSIVVNTLDGLGSVDPELIRMNRTLDGSRWSTFRRIELPAALPSIFTGVRISATYAAIGAVFGEWAGSTNGLGYVMLQATPQLQTALVFAAVLILTVLAVSLFAFVSFVERLAVPWAKPERGGHA
jgi:putative hydroxymethylpyrimidine transport system permease protein